MQFAFVVIGAAILATSALLFLHTYRTVVRTMVESSLLLNAAIIIYFALMLAFFLGYLVVAFTSSAIDTTTSVILLFGSIFVLVTILLVGKLFHNIKVVERNQLDLLTGLFTKTAFEALVGEVIARNGGACAGCKLAVLDLNRFKEVNDTLGHLKGDEILRITSDAIRKHLLHDEFCGRFGGDEFVIFSPSRRAETFDGRVAEIQHDVAAQAKSLCGGLCVTISAGIAEFSQPADFASTFEQADARMYRNKQAARFDDYPGVEHGALEGGIRFHRHYLHCRSRGCGVFGRG